MRVVNTWSASFVTFHGLGTAQVDPGGKGAIGAASLAGQCPSRSRPRQLVGAAASLISSLDGEEFLTGRKRQGPTGSHPACNLSPRRTSTRVAAGPTPVIGVHGLTK